MFSVRLLRDPLSTQATIANEALRRVHHIALNVRDIQVSCDFYGGILGLHQLIGDEIPSTLIDLVAAGKVANFRTPDGTVLDLLWHSSRFVLGARTYTARS